MGNENVTTPPMEFANVPESASHSVLDVLLRYWPRIASTAWQGYQENGRGVIILTGVPDAPGVTYQAGAPCECHEELVASYDPEADVVVMILDPVGDVAWIERVGGRPTPRELWATAPAGVLGTTLH